MGPCLPLREGIDGYQILGLSIISASEHDNGFHIVYIYDNTSTQSCEHGRHLLNLFLGEVITTDLDCFMEFPVHVHVLNNSSKDTTNTNRNIVLISEADFLECLQLLGSQQLRVVARSRKFWQFVLFQLLKKQSHLFLCLN